MSVVIKDKKCALTMVIYVGSECRREEDIINLLYLCSVAIAIPKVASWRSEYDIVEGMKGINMHDVIQCII